MAEKKAAKNAVTINGEDYETADVPYGDKVYTMRELSVKENRTIEKASMNEAKEFDGQMNLQLCIAQSIVSPPTTFDEIENWGGKKYLVLSRAFNKLNSLQDEPVPNS